MSLVSTSPILASSSRSRIFLKNGTAEIVVKRTPAILASSVKIIAPIQIPIVVRQTPRSNAYNGFCSTHSGLIMFSTTIFSSRNSLVIKVYVRVALVYNAFPLFVPPLLMDFWCSAAAAAPMGH